MASGTTTPSSQTPTTPSNQVRYVVEHEFESMRGHYGDTPPAVNSMDSNSDRLLICTACGTQYDTEDRELLTRCRICDDPRQFVPPAGQAFTTLSELKRQGCKNKWKVIDEDDRFWSIWTEPKVAIGQRCILIKTPFGNVLWDCITFLDEETKESINSLGGLAAIVISHPHYYTTHLEWADAFDCPVYLSWEDKQWLNRLDRLGKARTFIEGTEEEIEVRGEKTGVKALKLGGHFPGSLVCLAYKKLLVADTLVTAPAGLGDWSKGPDGGKGGRPPGMTSYSFMWSIPNMIPLSAEEIVGMWSVLQKHAFSSTHGAFVGTEIRDKYGGSKDGVKRRVLDSMKTQVWRMGWRDHKFLRET
ncbi:Uncharacterized protein LHYA1_G004721 [Lachnellula hyalina]|uniref:Metallo-beta-lactamase domain-containing protein n=1 Tax=Lachnellula hyalina TaxID=1316788 RepID=A0A8H8R277_9HELO|nr:Uncharacterized protein LHYA1_G004721 [Lachnellula hyalina]TVY26716.1 Uncharacterized protein LHYA1_G004721 [Lachnellula hyalina]